MLVAGCWVLSIRFNSECVLVYFWYEFRADGGLGGGLGIRIEATILSRSMVDGSSLVS